MPTLQGILETALYVKNVQTSADFYRRHFHFETLLESERLIALGVAGRDVLLLFKEGATKGDLETSGGIIPGHAGRAPTHFAFSIPADEFDSWQRELKAKGIMIESIVTWPGNARSLYFRDPDENLVELLTPGFWRIY